MITAVILLICIGIALFVFGQLSIKKSGDSVAYLCSSLGCIILFIIGFFIMTQGIPYQTSQEEFNKSLLLGGNLTVLGYSLFGNETGNLTINNEGQIELHGTARPKRELIFKATSSVKGASAPPNTLRDIGESGGVKDSVVSFSKTTQQDLYGIFHPPDDLDNSTNISFHLMWAAGEDWTSGSYNWTLEYLIKCEDFSYESRYGAECSNSTYGTPSKIWESITPDNSDDFIETEFTSTIQLSEEQVMTVHFYRDVANDDADDVGDIRFFEAQYYVHELGEYE